MANTDLKSLIIITTLIFLIAPVFIIIYIFVYNQRKKKHIEEKEHLKITFQQELLKTRMEVQEQTLNNISREIHDNITQVLSFVKLNLGLIDDANKENQKKISESRELVAQTINDLRYLSKSLSFEYITEHGLVKTIETETDRINNSGLININLNIDGTPYSLGEQRELVLFRIFQESLNNTLKHSSAKYLKINLQYSELLFNLTLEDDGIGFTIGPDNNKGSGLKNMQSRAALIGAVTGISSAPGNGCLITVTLNPIESQLFDDGTPKNRFG